MGYSLTISLLVAVCLYPAIPAWAAKDGLAGPSSQASLSISLHVPHQVRISRLVDIALQRQANASLGGTSEVCIYSHTGRYQLQALGSGSNSGFKLSQAGAGASRSDWTYQVEYDDGSGAKSLTNSAPLAGLGGADSGSQDCSNTGANGLLRVSSQPVEGLRQRQGHYTGTLTLLVAPE